MTEQEKLEELERQGFDKCSADEDEDTIRVRCSQCEALVINGRATHEMGCPNKPLPSVMDYPDEEDFDPFEEPFDSSGDDEPTEYDIRHG